MRYVIQDNHINIDLIIKTIEYDLYFVIDCVNLSCKRMDMMFKIENHPENSFSSFFPPIYTCSFF